MPATMQATPVNLPASASLGHTPVAWATPPVLADASRESSAVAVAANDQADKLVLTTAATMKPVDQIQQHSGAGSAEPVRDEPTSGVHELAPAQSPAADHSAQPADTSAKLAAAGQHESAELGHAAGASSAAAVPSTSGQGPSYNMCWPVAVS